MRTLTVQKKAIRAIKNGAPLLTDQTFESIPEYYEGEQVKLVTPEKEFLGMAYLAKQNKGIGWVYSIRDNTEFAYPFFVDQFKRASKKREGLLQAEETNAFRLVNGEGDRMPGLTVDYYNEFAVFSWYSEGIYSYQEEIVEAFREVFPSIRGAYEKRRYQSNEEEVSKPLFGEEAPMPHLIKENGIQFATYLNEGWMTGIFLDQRPVRNALLENYAAGKTVLNLFSYTGAFSVAAAMGGATHTTSVDAANRAKEKTAEQFEVNGLDASEQTVHVMDVFDYIRYATRKGLTFDVIVVDPPSFARTKKRTFAVSKDFGSMVEALVPIASKEATFIFSTNAAGYKRDAFQKDIEDALTESGVRASLVEEFGLPEDFPAPRSSMLSNYLKVMVYQTR